MNKCLFLLLSVFLLINPGISAQFPSLQQKAIVLKRMVEMKHFSPRQVNDSFSLSVFKTILNITDSRRLFFTEKEYNQLAKFSTKLDDELKGDEWNFSDLFSRLYQNALQRADTIIDKLLKKPFDFSKLENISRSKNIDTFIFSADVTALANRWSRYLKLKILSEVYETIKNDSTNKISFKEALTSFEPGVRDRLKKTESKSLAKILNPREGYSALIAETYLNAIASCFDPHTHYFSPMGKEKFQEELSTESYSFGIEFEENEAGKVVVDKLTPGGPAWKSGEINKGDELLSLLWEGKEVQDMNGTTLDEVYEVLEQSLHDKLLFRFRKQDGTISMVLLMKEKSVNEESIVKSFVLKTREPVKQVVIKTGYILLPGFYTEWENDEGSSCANDVAKEIIKLRKENIDGLILDIRYNGGGSISEALEMIGIFIEVGPLAAIKERNGKIITLKDPNRGTIYDGPLVVMVNGQSASASELLAAALQDYNRAVIIGSTTFGKATGQTIFPMDTTSVNRNNNTSSNKDIIKITMSKLYRVNGQTAQLKGVTPDILLPDAFEGLEIGERFAKFSLSADSIPKNNYYKPLHSLPIKELSLRSNMRIAKINEFSLMKKIYEERKKNLQNETQSIPLNVELFEKWARQIDASLEIANGINKPLNIFSVENHAADKNLLANDTNAMELNESWLENLMIDIYVQEAFLVLSDLINLQRTSTQN